MVARPVCAASSQKIADARVDQEWLDAVNAERKKDQSGPVSYEAFEIIIDKLEKEWFNLVCFSDYPRRR